MRPSADKIIMSRLLILQSKRLMLSSLDHRRSGAADVVQRRADALRTELGEALEHYRRAMLSLGVPEDADYWTAAYGKLIDTANELVERMREAAPEMTASHRYAVSGEVEMLESLMDGWRTAMRLAIAKSAA